MYMYIYVYIYMYVYVCTCVYAYAYIHMLEQEVLAFSRLGVPQPGEPLVPANHRHGLVFVRIILGFGSGRCRGCLGYPDSEHSANLPGPCTSRASLVSNTA